jgi:NitT/TauT family transport system substrate-binding protein
LAISALIREEIDVLAGGMSAALINVIKNGDIKITAGKGRASSGCSYVSLLTTKKLAESGKLFVSDKWKERRIFIRGLRNFSSYFFAKTLEGFGLNIKEAKIVKISDAIIGEAFLNNALDIAITGEPWITRIKTVNKDITEAVKLQEILPDFQIAAVLYGKRLLYQDTNLGKRFMAAYLKGVRQYNKGKTKRNLEIVAEATKLDKDILEKACWPLINNSGAINVDSIIEF